MLTSLPAVGGASEARGQRVAIMADQREASVDEEEKNTNTAEEENNTQTTEEENNTKTTEDDNNTTDNEKQADTNTEETHKSFRDLVRNTRVIQFTSQGIDSLNRITHSCQNPLLLLRWRDDSESTRL